MPILRETDFDKECCKITKLNTVIEDTRRIYALVTMGNPTLNVVALVREFSLSVYSDKLCLDGRVEGISPELEPAPHAVVL